MEKISGTILGIAGPSGSGKNYLINALCRAYPDTFVYIPSATTKPDDGSSDYLFVTDEKFEELAQTDDLINNEKVVGYSYGYVKSFTEKVLKAGQIGIITPYPPVAGRVFEDFKSCFNLKTFCIYLKPEEQTIATLRTRMMQRARGEDLSRIEAKLRDAEKQIIDFDLFKDAFDVVFPIRNDINPIIKWVGGNVIKD